MNRVNKKLVLTALAMAFCIYIKGQTYSNSTSAYQILFINNNQHSNFGSGISLMDFNDDGLDDITLATAEGDSIVFYLNTGGNFSRIPSLVNHTGEAESVIWIDYDNDGDKDLYVSANAGPNKLYQNNGALSFIDVSTNLGLSDSSSETFGVCWGDYNRDGYLDLYEANRQFLYNETNQLYLNDSAQQFLNTTITAGVTDSSHMGFAANFMDFNNDFWPDIFVANDKLHGNKLFKNLGNNVFSDISLSSNMNATMNSMTATIGDYNNDGYFDVYVTNTQEGNALFRNNGDETFTDVTDSMGVAVNGVCWGASFFDFDLDGDQDLYVSDMRRDSLSKNTLFENTGSSFIAHSPAFPDDKSMSLAHAMADFNNDGHWDVIAPNQDPDSLQFWLSNGNSKNNWIKLDLEGRVSNRDGIGTQIEIRSGGKKQFRYMHCGGSYLGQNAGYEIFGLEKDSIVDTLVFHWNSGHIDSLFNYPSNQYYHIVEGGSVFPQLNKLGTQWFCKMDSIHIDLEVENAHRFEHFLWSTGDTSSIITIQSPGDYWVSTRTAHGLMDSSLTLSIRVDSLSLSSTSVSDTNNLGVGMASVTPMDGYPPFQYQWNDPLNQTSMIAHNLHHGSYQVQVTDSLGCRDSLTVLVPNYSDIGLKKSLAQHFLLYPNPASSSVEIHRPTSFGGTYNLSVYKTDGTIIHMYKWESMEKLQLNLNGWAKGFYIISIKDSESQVLIDTLKLMVK